MYDFMALVKDFEEGKLGIHRLNFALIVLIPKEVNAKDFKKFRPISLSTCAIKIFNKAMTNRFSPICNRIISSNQTNFIKGRYILESVVMAHEVVDEVKKSDSQGLILKLDYEKAYDRVSWEFIFEMLHSRGFGSRWISWIKGPFSMELSVLELMIHLVHTLSEGMGLNKGTPLSLVV